MPLLTIRLPENATLAAAQRALQLSDDEVDLGYGLIAVDPAQHLYALRVTDTAATRVAAVSGGAADVFADPRIGTADFPQHDPGDQPELP
ncbi:hypothetical protein [Nocardia veterana]|uniref:Uncharacterized protein n=1 Tax=Nocardia veterana TaxID=132249 RepID=A0A7X6LVH8_9NOCA|nr:hypothetical protein [Nocardia veterana]NKY85350.1 hypothetical protein [Nocardia veterana]